MQSLFGINQSYCNGSSTGELTWTNCIVLINMSSESTANSEPSYLTARLPQISRHGSNLRRTTPWRVTKASWSNVDFGLNLINFKETKTNRDRAVPMEPIVREALLELSQHNGNAEYVFTNPDTGTRYTDVKKSFSAACREAGITNFTFHDLRHTFGTRLADAGVDVVKIKELMGHASIVTTMRYIHATDQGKRGAITVLSEYRQKRRHKFVTDEKRQAVQPAVNH